jgi:hypothetical protein
MDVAMIYAAYLAVSIGLTVAVASALSRSGHVFLCHVFGGDEGMAGAVNRMLVVGFYLLSLGYAALTLRTSGQIRGPAQAVDVLSVKVGEELLVLGALYLFNIAVFARFRRRQGASGQGTGGQGVSGQSAGGQGTGPGQPATPATTPREPGQAPLRPGPREAIH